VEPYTRLDVIIYILEGFVALSIVYGVGYWLLTGRWIIGW
jgi:hypothetical protein